VHLADHIGRVAVLHNRLREQEELHTGAQGDMESVHGFHHIALLVAGHSHLAVEDSHHAQLEVVTDKESVLGEGIGPVEEDRDYLHTGHDPRKGIVLGALRVGCTDRIHRSLVAVEEVGCNHHRNILVQTC